MSPSIDLAGAEAPLLDLATLAERVKAIETTPDAPTLHHLAVREPTSFHQSTIYYGLGRQNTPAWRKYGLLAAIYRHCISAVLRRHWIKLRGWHEHVQRTIGLQPWKFLRRGAL